MWESRSRIKNAFPRFSPSDGRVMTITRSYRTDLSITGNYLLTFPLTKTASLIVGCHS